MANAARGDSKLFAGGKDLVMRLTLGALAEIEDGLGKGTGWSGIADGLRNLGSRDIAVVASALLKGGGYNVSPDEVMMLETDVGSLVGAITGAFQGAAAPAATAAPAQGSSSPLTVASSTGTPSSNSASA